MFMLNIPGQPAKVAQASQTLQPTHERKFGRIEDAVGHSGYDQHPRNPARPSASKIHNNGE